MEEAGRVNAGEARLRNLLIRGLAGDEPAYHAFLQELSGHLRAFLRKRLASLAAASLFAALRLSRPGMPLAWAPGALAGAVGALVYCLHCAEMTTPFIGVWYLLGMLIPSAVGALLGPRLLRW